MKFLILTYILFFPIFAFSQNDTTVQLFSGVSNVNEILKADTIYFNLFESGCFHSNTEKITIIKTAEKKYSVKLVQNDGRIIAKVISQKALNQFGNLYKEQYERVDSCISTTAISISIKSKFGLTYFVYRGCKKKKSPMNLLKKKLKL